MRSLILALGAGLILAMPLQADPVTEALKTAITAYEEGDIQYALDEISNARRLIGEQKTASLAAFLPEAPEGWSRKVSTEGGQAMAMFGGGIFVEAEYISADRRNSFTVKLIADSPMVAQMGAMLNNTAMIAQSGSKVRRINRVRFIEQENSLQGMIGNRVLLQADGEAADMLELTLGGMDFAALETFGN